MNIFHTQDQRRKGLLDYAPNGTLRSRHPEGNKVPDASLNVGIPSLEISSSISPGKQTYFLAKQLITIGRAPDNMVVLNHFHVSSHHAQLELVQGGYCIVDTGSTNHIYVNGQEVKSRLLQPSDEVCIGPFKLIYTCTQLTQHDESNSIRIDALHLKRVGNKETILLNDISLAIPPRKLVALLGSTGSGKSTLLDALNGLRPAQQGKVYYNGRDYYRNLAAFSTQLGYVPQDDIVHRDLTVEHALSYAARMRLPRGFTKAQIKERVAQTG